MPARISFVAAVFGADMNRDPDWPDWVDTVTFYEWAASILINADEEQSKEDSEEIDKLLEYIRPAYVVGIVDDSQNFGRPECGGLPGTVVDYIIHYPH